MNFFQTFRGRLLLVLAILLVVTLGVQFYLNLLKEWDNARLRELQEQALVAGFALGAASITSQDRLQDIVKKEGQRFFDEQTTERIQEILVIDNEWEIYDSLSERYQGTTDEEGNSKYIKLAEITDLPPLMEVERLGDDRARFPNTEKANSPYSGEAHVVPIETTKGRFYIMVILKDDGGESLRRASWPLIYNLAVLLVSTLITIFLVRRFTRPIANLSDAARRVASGDLGVRLNADGRTDEIGQLTSQFNEMTAQLEKNRELESQLQQAEKSAVVGRLASAIAHEIRNPLNYINLTLDHLRAKFSPESEKQKADFEKLTAQLKTEVGRINTQVSDFLRYSRPLKLELRPAVLKEVVGDSLRLVEAQAEEQGISVKMDDNAPGVEVLCDPETLRSVFNNLLINAVQAMEKDGGILTVALYEDEGFGVTSIKDTGVGIPAENLEKIFEPYFSTKETGTGLGLAIVKRIVDEHHGTIEVESTPDEGTIFKVKLPIAR